MAKKEIEDTPLLRQFYEVKAQHPEALLLYRVGDFYETYGSDAPVASKALGLVLTKRSNGDKEPVPMAGFPHHALETYLTKLVKAGFKVAVCDQLEDPKLVGRKLVKRGVTELVTPGLAFGENMLEQKENNFLAGICCGKSGIGVAFLDASTGEFKLTQGSVEYINTLFSSLRPKELIVDKSFEKKIREQFQDYYITAIDSWAFVYEPAVEKLRKQLGVESLKGFAIDEYPLGICAAGAVMAYLEMTCHSGLSNICSVSRIDNGKFVWMDKFTFRNLEIFQSTAAREGVALVDIMDRCLTPMGARLLRQWLAMPVMDINELENRFDSVQYFIDNPHIRQKVSDVFSRVGDLERILGRIASGRAYPKEIRQLGRALENTLPIIEMLKESGCSAISGLCSQFRDCTAVLERIQKLLLDEPASQIGKGDVIASGIDAELDELRRISSGGKDYLLDMQKRESERTGISPLKIAYNSVFGYYIEVRNTSKDKVPQEWVRRQTLVNAERYITEELKEYEEKILTAEENILKIETRIYNSLIADIQRHIEDIQFNGRILARLDVLLGFAELAVESNYCRPVIDNSNSLDIIKARHPVIEAMMPPGEEYVPNDIHLDNSLQQIIILTGPNMAGKSALLRQTALIVLMAQVGSFVPASEARFGYFDKIFTRVGASDNISRGESTFMVEMLETSMILHNLSQRSLILLDEIGRGTSTYDGMSIARAIVEYIHNYGQGAKTLFATHYHELNDLERIYPRIRNFHIAVKESGKRIIFLRQLKEGGSENSFGIHVARMAGMPLAVLESAEKTLSSLEKKKGRTPLGHEEEDGSLQFSLFQLDDPLLESLRDKLNATDLNNITPLQAFDLLRSMKEELGLNK